ALPPLHRRLGSGHRAHDERSHVARHGHEHLRGTTRRFAHLEEAERLASEADEGQEARDQTNTTAHEHTELEIVHWFLSGRSWLTVQRLTSKGSASIPHY